MGEVAVLGRTLCTKTRGRGLYQMIHSSPSASTASVFNWLIRSCLKPFSAVLPLKTRFLVQMRQDCLRLQCGWNKSSKTRNVLCAQHFHQHFMGTSYSSRDVASKSLFFIPLVYQMSLSCAFWGWGGKGRYIKVYPCVVKGGPSEASSLSSASSNTGASGWRHLEE